MRPAAATAEYPGQYESPGNVPKSAAVPALLANASNGRLLLGVHHEPRRVGWVRPPAVPAAVRPGHAAALREGDHRAEVIARGASAGRVTQAGSRSKACRPSLKRR